jgi:hypothetical protein
MHASSMPPASSRRDGAEPNEPLDHVPRALGGEGVAVGTLADLEPLADRLHFGPCPVFPDLMGFGPVAPEHTVDWSLQIDVNDHAPAIDERAARARKRLAHG